MSPVLDAERLALLRVEMQSNNPATTPHPDELRSDVESSSVIAKYIGKKVTLIVLPETSRRMSTDIPQGSRIHVFVKHKDQILSKTSMIFHTFSCSLIVDDSVNPLPAGSTGDVVDFEIQTSVRRMSIDVKLHRSLWVILRTTMVRLQRTPINNSSQLFRQRRVHRISSQGRDLRNRKHRHKSLHDGLGPVIRRIRCAAIDVPRAVVAPPHQQNLKVKSTINTANLGCG